MSESLRCLYFEIGERDASEVMLPSDLDARTTRIQQLVGGHFDVMRRLSHVGSHTIYMLEHAHNRGVSQQNAFMHNLQVVFSGVPTIVYGSALLVGCSARGDDVTLPAYVQAAHEDSWVSFIRGEPIESTDDGNIDDEEEDEKEDEEEEEEEDEEEEEEEENDMHSSA